MIKMVRFVKKRSDLTDEQFKKYWLEEHNKLEKLIREKTPAKKIAANFVLPESAFGKRPDFDGMVEVYFDNIEGFKAMFASGIPQRLHKDEENFVDLSVEQTRFLVEEYVMGEK